MDDEKKEVEKNEDEDRTSSQSSIEDTSKDQHEEVEKTEDDKDEEKGGLRFAPWIGAGFGLIASGYLAKYFLDLFKSMKVNISPNVGNIFITLGIIVLLVTLTAEIFTAVKED